jgi:SAM-dependent methyltransferase
MLAAWKKTARRTVRFAKRRLLGDPWTRAYRRLREPKTLEELTLDEPAILAALEASPIPVERLRLDPEEYRAWRRRADYETHHPDYYRENIIEKSLEHFIASKLLELKPGEVYIDMASQNGVAAEIVGRLFGVEAYEQDLDFEPGLQGRRIGSDAGAMPLPDSFADALALHCSFEHFEGDADMRFIREAGRVLKPGGRLASAPLYLCHEYACIANPLLAVPGGVRFEPDIRVHAMRSWQNRHGRFYDVPRLIERVWDNRGPLEMTVFIVENFREIDSSCYLRHILFAKKPCL